MRLFIVRHGETDWNRAGRFQGQRDTELTEHGLAQADKAADYLRGRRFDAVVTSPLARARVTAQKIYDAAECDTFEVIDDLTEINHGDWEGRLSTEVAETWPDLLETWHTRPHVVVMPGEGGESLRAVQIRTMRAVEDIASRYSGDVVLASHDAVIKVMLCAFTDAPLSSFWSFQIANCSLTVAELREGHAPRISLLGDAHFLGIGFDLPEQKGL